VLIAGATVLAGGWILVLVVTVRHLLRAAGGVTRSLSHSIFRISGVQVALGLLGLVLLMGVLGFQWSYAEISVALHFLLPCVVVLGGGVVAWHRERLRQRGAPG
jgi:hypothetical protein